MVIRTDYDGLIVGAYVGLGFQVLEDMLYGQNSAYENFGVDRVGAVLHTLLTGTASRNRVNLALRFRSPRETPLQR